MKKFLTLVLPVMFLFASCGFSNGLTSNLNQHNTTVELSESNFTVVDHVQGTATATYAFGLGGLKKKALIAKARANMLENAGLVGTSRAVINETVETHVSLFPIVRRVTVTVSAHVVEFK